MFQTRGVTHGAISGWQDILGQADLVAPGLPLPTLWVMDSLQPRVRVHSDQALPKSP